MLPETVRGLKEYQDIAYGAVLILILIFAPEGPRVAVAFVVRQTQGGRMILLSRRAT